MTTTSGRTPGGTSRRLRLPDAAGTGLAATLGAGLFVALAPAATAAGDHLLSAVVLAALVAVANAVTSVRLAPTQRSPLGTHVHGRARLGVAWGHLSGWAFVVGKTSACAALALTIGVHLLPDVSKVVAAVAVLAVLLLNLQGIERSARGARIIALLVVLLLLTFVTVLLVTPPVLADAPPTSPDGSGSLVGIAQAAGFVFFALTGHIGLVNVRNEVADPQRTIPRAVALSLGAVILLLVLVAVALLRTLGAGWVAAREAPLAEAAEISAWPWLGPALRVAAVLAAGGVLMGLMLTVSGSVAAMARDRHLPAVLAVREGPKLVPRRAESVVAAFVIVSVVLVDLRQAIAFASFCVLVHCALAHASAWTLDARWTRRIVPALGLVMCLGIAALLPWESVLAGVIVLALGSVIGWVRHTTRE